MDRQLLEALKVQHIIQDYRIHDNNEVVIVPVKPADHIKINTVVSDVFKKKGERI